MGNKHGKNTPPEGTVHIRTEKAFYYAGETVRGFIYVYLQKEFQGKDLVLKIKGKEETGHNFKGKNPQHKGKCIFYNHRIPIYSWTTGSIPVGQYEFPFSFILDPTLPGTFSSQNLAIQALIGYKLKVELVPHDKKAKIHVKTTIPLVLREPVKQEVTSMQKAMAPNISTWGCIGEGRASIKCNFERNAYAAGENLTIFCEIDNSKCQVAIPTIRCVLRRNIKLVTDGGRRSYSDLIDLITTDFPGVAARENATGDKKKMFTLKLEPAQNIPHSTSGTYITCIYTLHLTPTFDTSMCCGEPFEISVPITIFAPAPELEVITPPGDWNPQVMDPMNIVLKDEYAYQTRDHMSPSLPKIQVPSGIPLDAHGMVAPPAPNPFQ